MDKIRVLLWLIGATTGKSKNDQIIIININNYLKTEMIVVFLFSLNACSTFPCEFCG